mmetsp:Transcript_64491/g.189110  ORF Transcript_64491/g.189110 Transcript_64491/m.189110 type:complete len:210 (+) Transcript_64491:189-818(+)
MVLVRGVIGGPELRFHPPEHHSGGDDDHRQREAARHRQVVADIPEHVVDGDQQGQRQARGASAHELAGHGEPEPRLVVLDEALGVLLLLVEQHDLYQVPRHRAEQNGPQGRHQGHDDEYAVGWVVVAVDDALVRLDDARHAYGEGQGGDHHGVPQLLVARHEPVHGRRLVLILILRDQLLLRRLREEGLRRLSRRPLQHAPAASRLRPI